MKRELNRVFKLIESFDKEDINNALNIIKLKSELKNEVLTKYLPIIKIFGGTTLRSLLSLEVKILRQAKKKGKSSSLFFLKFNEANLRAV